MSNILVELEGVTVDIPLRGLRNNTLADDKRIFKDDKGGLYLRALDNISLCLRSGDRMGVVGGNGSGKTTLLKLIAGMLPLSSGRIRVNGKLRSLLSAGTGLSQSLTGRQTIKLYYSLLGIAGISLQEFTDNVVDFSELGVFIDMPVSIYSPGMRSRLQFAMNTIESADILLLDEWLGVSDPAFQAKARKRLESYILKNEVFLFASHNEKLISSVTDKKIVMDNGRLSISNAVG